MVFGKILILKRGKHYQLMAVADIGVSGTLQQPRATLYGLRVILSYPAPALGNKIGSRCCQRYQEQQKGCEGFHRKCKG